MSKPNYCKVGFVSKPKGLKGALRVSFEDFFLAYLEENQIDHIFVDIKGQFAPFFIEAIEGLDSNAASIKFEDIDNIKAASPLQNSSLYFEEDLLKIYLEADEEEWEYLIGYTLIDDSHQTIGVIEGIVYLPQHELLQLTYADRELLIPIHEDMVIIIDEQAKILQMELPEGILEL
ncbi:MAG: ribosome maturation factor RimM [Chitinophagales bacterium]